MNVRPALLPAFGVFATAARHQNFAHAAEELHLTASAVSHHVRRLEAALGVT
ncbi:MAG: LysR family transcriptional regulator, partial [Steroidobacteraceae bacterium]